MTSRRKKKQIVFLRQRKKQQLLSEQEQELERLAQDARDREQKKLEEEAQEAEKKLLDELGVEKKIETVKTEDGKEEEKIEIVSKKKAPKNALKEIKKEEVKPDEQA